MFLLAPQIKEQTATIETVSISNWAVILLVVDSIIQYKDCTFVPLCKLNTTRHHHYTKILIINTASQCGIDILQQTDTQLFYCHLPHLGKLAYGLPSSIDAAISAPTPNWGQPPSMVTKRFVFFTEVAMHSMSNGLMLRRFITCLPTTQNQNDPIKCKLLMDSWDTLLQGNNLQFSCKKADITPASNLDFIVYISTQGLAIKMT